MTHTAASNAAGLLDHVVERLADGFLALDGEGRITYLNHAAANLLRERFGAVSGGLAGHVLWEKLPRTRDTALEAAVRRAAADEEPATIREWDPAFQRTLESRVFPADGGVTILIRDVTELGLPPDTGEPGSWEWDIAH